jgi:excisionase family DNA binding protein
VSDLLSIGEAAERLDLSQARVRAMAASGQLPSRKVGSRWLLDATGVEVRRRSGGHRGRPFSPANAWACLLLASGEKVPGIESGVRSRLRRSLILEGIEGLEPRLRGRAEVHRFRSHPGEIAHLAKEPSLVRSGISAARALGFDLMGGREVDGYIPAGELEAIVEEHALEPLDGGANVILRAVPDDAAWRWIAGRSFAPEVAVALDLAEEADSRSAQAGRRGLERIDGSLRSAR